MVTENSTDWATAGEARKAGDVAADGARADPPYRIAVYKYAVHGDVPEPVIEEIRRGHQLQNKLVEIELRHEDRVAEIWSHYPDVAEAKTHLRDVEEQLAELLKQVAKEQQDADRRAPSAELAAQVAAARAARRDARRCLKAAKDVAYPTAKPQMQDARKARDAQIKATYREFVDAGLYWATYNDIAAAHKVAVAGIVSKRKAGQPAQLRFRRSDGTGRIKVQLQRDKTAPVRTPELLAAGTGPWVNVFQLSPWIPPERWEAMTRAQQRRAARGTCRIRIGSGQHATNVTLPVIVHRPIPADADITEVRVVRTRTAGRFHAAIAVTARLPRPEARAQGAVAAVHLGWRTLNDGALRVAVIGGHGPVPSALADVVRAHGTWAEVVIPASLCALHHRIHGLRSQRDASLGNLKQWLTAWLSRRPGARQILDPEGTMARWRSAGRFAALALQHRDAPPQAVREAVERIEAWRVQDRHLWEWEANARDQMIAYRRDAWRRVASWICQTPVAAIAVGGEWDSTAPTRRPGFHGDDGHLDRAGRADRYLAAPGELRQAVEQAADARGVALIPSPGGRVHHACGRPFGDVSPAGEVMVWCASCETLVDQDVNALHLLQANVQGQLGSEPPRSDE